jgi:hypothetical protein
MYTAQVFFQVIRKQSLLLFFPVYILSVDKRKKPEIKMLCSALISLASVRRATGEVGKLPERNCPPFAVNLKFKRASHVSAIELDCTICHGFALFHF